MAKKKNKKNNQKQGDAVSLPEGIDPPPATATEESSAPGTTFEAQEQLLAPPLETTNGEDPVQGPTSLTDQHHEVAQDRPSESEPSMVAGSSSNSGTTQSFGNDHMSMATGALNEEHVTPAADVQVHTTTEEKGIQPPVEETVHHSQTLHKVLNTVPEPTVVADLTVPTQSNTLSDSGLRVDVVEPQAAELSVSTATEDPLTARETPYSDPSGLGAPMNIDVKDSTSHLDDINPREPVVIDARTPPQHNDTSEVGSRISVEDTLSSSVAPEAPAMESFRSSFKTMLPPTEHSSKAQVAILEQFEQAEALQAVQASVQNDLPLTMLSQPKSERTTDVGQSLPANTSESHATGNLSLPPISQPPPAEQVERDAQVSFADFDPRTSQKETGKQRRKREAEEIRQREEQERRDQESFEQYRIDQERLEMKRLEQKRLEREKSRQERIERERIEQERLNRERIEQERANEERVKKEKLEKARLEQQRLEEERLREERLKQEKLKQEKLEQERLEQERLEQERLEQERLEQERLEQERLEQERLEQERLEQERLEEKRIEQQILEQQRLDVQRQQEEKINKRRLEEQQIGDNALESKGVEKEAAAATEAVELSREDIHQAETEAADRFETQHIQPSTLAQKSMGEMTSGPTTELLASPGVQQRRVFNQATIEPAQQPTPHSQASSYPPITSNDMRTSNPASRLPTPAASVGRGNSPHSMTMEAPKTRVSQAPSPTMSAHGSRDVESATHSRHTTSSPALPAPRPQAVSQIIDDSRPPAPSPPVGRVRPRHIPAFDSDDESDSAMVRPRRQFRGGEEFSRDGSSGSAQGYPPQPTHHRSVFASRVPAEPSYSNPPPPQPPGYHPGYYPSTAPPHYQNHNYRVSQPGYPHPNTYGPPSHSSSSPYTEPWNYPPGYRHDSPPQRHDTLVTRDYSLGLDTRPALGDDPGDVFSRISQAIPDLHVLLARYKETHGQLSVREELLRRSSVEQEERLRVKDDEIAELKERARTLEHKYSTEASRLRFQIGNLEEEARELQEQRIETAKFKKEAQDTKSALEAAMKSWEAKYKELEEAHAALARTSAEEKADFDEWKSSYTTRNDAEKIALAIQFDKRLKEADVLAESQRQDAIAIHVQEKDELQASFDKTRNELETKLGSAQQDREEALRHERESREIWLAEREALIKSHQDDRESIRRGWDEQRGLLEAHYKKSKDESDRAWIDLHADASQKANEEKARVDELIKEKEELQKKYNALKAESEKEKAIIKSVASNLESEKSRLEKLMECYGDIAEIKSKGDTYYLVSFSQLQKQIIDLATTHFVHLPVRPPAEDLAQVPSNLPSFLGDTTASRQVRAAYVAHTVSKLITYRVFGPFLFSLGRRYDKADSLFLSMSHHIRDKSTRKEAIWRQQTLLAAFTSSGAKQRINTAAGTVVEEIVNAIKHFADPREEEGIKIAVKRIVKLAAETWRFARLEREMINATMPALLDEEHQFTGPEYWPSYESYKPEGTLIGSLVGTSPAADEQPQLLLRLFPVIWRESKHENFHTDGEKPDAGCVFHHGLALYDDAEPVVQRMEELKSAGLPSYTTTASPTIAENGKFPPPIVPPPREAPPNPPTPAENTQQSTTRTAPSSPAESSAKPSVRQTTPPPPPSSIPSLYESTPSMPVKAYKRPPPGPIDFASPRNLIGLPPPIESMKRPQPSTTKKTPEAPAEPRVAPPPPPSAPPPPPPIDYSVEEYRQPTPAESAILPTSFPEPSPSEGKSREPPTPPHSRSGTPTERPISPLFEAVDEIEALQNHRSRQPSKSLSRRRSTHSRRSKEEVPEVNPTTDRHDTSRRTSGYAISARSAKTADSERTDRTERTEKTDKSDRTDKSERDPKSRYMCESRSAAVKALYPNSPMAGQSSNSSSKNSVSSSKKKDRDSRELKRERSIPDNGTWDTSSNLTSEATNTQFSIAKKKDRDSRELKRERSIPDNGTWDTSSNLTSEATNTQLSTN